MRNWPHRLDKRDEVTIKVLQGFLYYYTCSTCSLCSISCRDIYVCFMCALDTQCQKVLSRGLVGHDGTCLKSSRNWRVSKQNQHECFRRMKNRDEAGGIDHKVGQRRSIVLQGRSNNWPFPDVLDAWPPTHSQKVGHLIPHQMSMMIFMDMDEDIIE